MIKLNLKTIGPGLLYAGAAIGVSHLVQSTRAGAEFGYSLLWVIIFTHILKYPFFLIGPKYASITGKSLLTAYKKQGTLPLILFVGITLCTMFIIQSAIILVTSGIAANVFGNTLSSYEWALIILTVCYLILLIGKFSILDNLVKIIIIILSITTIAAVSIALLDSKPSLLISEPSFSISNKMHLAFLIAFLGWMPAPLDISVWHSVWTVAKNRQINTKVSLRNSLLDFKIGFWGTAFMAICFLLLGARMMYGSGEQFSPKGAEFAGQLIKMYTGNLGNWAYVFIVIAAFTTMFSTALTCFDAFPRVLRPSFKLLIPQYDRKSMNKKLYRFWLTIVFLGTITVITFFIQNMQQMVNLATTISFLIAPILAWFNYKAINSDEIPKELKPSKSMNILSLIGLGFLIVFSTIYLFSLI